MISRIFHISDQISDDRTLCGIFNHAISEMGELATELNIVAGQSYKQPGSDGIVGEAIDAIICLVDLIHKHNPNMTEQDIANYTSVKLKKWKDSVVPNAPTILSREYPYLGRWDGSDGNIVEAVFFKPATAVIVRNDNDHTEVGKTITRLAEEYFEISEADA